MSLNINEIDIFRLIIDIIIFSIALYLLFRNNNLENENNKLRSMCLGLYKDYLVEKYKNAIDEIEVENENDTI